MDNWIIIKLFSYLRLDMPQIQKMRYTIQFSILMLCAKYQEAGLCGSREKCDRNYLVSKFVYVHNILSRVKQEVDMRQIQKFMLPIGLSDYRAVGL